MSTLYQEDESSTFESNGKIYNLNILFKLTHDKKVEMYPVSKLKWVLKYCKPDPERVIAADLSSPLLVGSLDGHDMTIDGLHRLTKVVANRVAHLPAKIVTSKMLEAALIKP